MLAQNPSEDQIKKLETIIPRAKWVCSIASGDETVDAKNAPGISAESVPNRRGLTVSLSAREKGAAKNSVTADVSRCLLATVPRPFRGPRVFDSHT